MTVDDLVSRFSEIGEAQDDALLYNEISRFNRLYKELEEIDNELRQRGLDARLSLLDLFAHPNMQVRLNAAKWSLAVAPVRARTLLEDIAASKHYPQAGDAGMSLWNLDRGVFKPT